MTHDEIEQYLSDKELNTFEYQLAMDAMLFAEQKTIERACEWLKEKNNMCMYELEMILGGNFIKDFKKTMNGE